MPVKNKKTLIGDAPNYDSMTSKEIYPEIEAGKQAVLLGVTIHNMDDKDVQVVLIVKDSSSEMPVFNTTIRPNESIFFAENIVLVEGDSLLTKSTADSKISVMASINESEVE